MQSIAPTRNACQTLYTNTASKIREQNSVSITINMSLLLFTGCKITSITAETDLGDD